jgi:DNA-binding transcriptional LysR family regulator
MLDLNAVRMFVQVVRARSFAEASRRLGVPPNTLSRRVRELETSLDTRLLQRSTRKLTLTVAGHAFFERCATAVDGMVEAGKTVLDRSQRPSGSVRIAAPADFLDVFHIDWVAEFLRLYPEVNLEFALSDARADLIGEGIDVAFRGGRLGMDPSTVYRQVTVEYFNLVASPAYLATHGMPQSLQELERRDCLLMSTGALGGTVWTLQGVHGDEEVNVSGRIRSSSARSLVKSCIAGLGIALLPTMLISPEIRAGRLIRVLPAYRRDGADFNVLLPSRLQIPSAVMAFVDFATDKLRSMTQAFEQPPAVASGGGAI